MDPNQLKNSIDNLTSMMARHIADQEPESTFALLERRIPLIAELIKACPAQIGRQELRGYLTALRARDQEMMNEICRLQKQLKGSLSNFNNLREYFVD